MAPCYDIHHNIAIDYVNGKTSIGPCCQSGRIEVDEGTIASHWNHPQLQKLRKQDYLDPGFCNSCITVELAGGKSRRQSQIEFYQGWDSNKKIRGLDIKLGNLCNLKCVICGPEYSTAWIADAEKLGKNIENFIYYDKKIQFELRDGTALLDLVLVHFWGGEPLIDNKHVKVLEFLDTLDILKNCRITYNTNGTHKVDDHVLSLWAKAKLVEIYFSIDDIGDRFEYQRYPAKWHTVLENLEWYKKQLPSNHLFYINCVISYLNIWYLSELVEWKVNNFDTNNQGDKVQLLFQPAFGPCAINTLTNHLKKQLVEKFARYPELLPYLEIPTTQSEYTPITFKKYIVKLDVIRETSWANIFKEFAEVLN